MSITVIRAIIIYITVIIAVRIMGKRQLGELSNHEFVITVLISAVATIPLEDNAIPLTNSLLPILIFISLEIIESAISMKSYKFSQLLEGKPIIIIKDGKLQQKELKRLRMTVSDVLDNLRSQGIFELSEVKNAIVEANGKLSVQRNDDSSEINIPIVLDGKTITNYFGNEILSDEEITLIVKSQNKELKRIMLLTLDKNGKAQLIEKEKNK